MTTPEEVATFAQELITPIMRELQPVVAEEIGQEGISENFSNSSETAVIKKPNKFSMIGLDKSDPSLSPWYDVVGNETEAKVVSLYGKGLTTRDIVSYLKSMHKIEMSQSSVSAITDKVFPLVKEWQSRPLFPCYPILYLDGLYFKVRESGKIVSKFAYIALGINQHGFKEVLGIWTSESEGSKFWMQVLNDLKNRGAEDILIACVDGLKGFPEAIKAIYPAAEVQTCIVHQIRHTIKFLPHKDRKKFCEDLRPVYGAPSEEAGLQALKEMEEQWPQYRPYLKSWENRWADLSVFFSYPEQIRRTIYTTNAIENLNRQFRKVTKTTTIFPHDDSLLKLLWLAQADITQKWTMPVRNWGAIMAQLAILFPDRVQF